MPPALDEARASAPSAAALLGPAAAGGRPKGPSCTPSAVPPAAGAGALAAAAEEGEGELEGREQPLVVNVPGGLLVWMWVAGWWVGLSAAWLGKDRRGRGPLVVC